MNFLRKYYVPGLISLIFLPIAFIFFAVDKIKIPKQYVQEHMPLSSKDSNRIKKFIPQYFSHHVLRKRFLMFLTGFMKMTLNDMLLSTTICILRQSRFMKQ